MTTLFCPYCDGTGQILGILWSGGVPYPIPCRCQDEDRNASQ